MKYDPRIKDYQPFGVEEREMKKKGKKYTVKCLDMAIRLKELELVTFEIKGFGTIEGKDIKKKMREDAPLTDVERRCVMSWLDHPETWSYDDERRARAFKQWMSHPDGYDAEGLCGLEE